MDLFERLAIARRAVVYVIDRFIADLVLRTSIRNVTLEPEFIAIYALYGRGADLVRALAPELAGKTFAERRHAYGALVIATVLDFVVLRIILAELNAAVAWWNRQPNGQLDTVTEIANSIVRLGSATGTVLVAVANLALILIAARVSIWANRLRQLWLHQVQKLLRPRLRVALNAQLTANEPTQLLVSDANGLAHLDQHDRWIDRPCSARIMRLTSRLGATSVAVSGRRGVGKSTLLRRMVHEATIPARPNGIRPDPVQQPSPLTVFVDAPVDYAPRDFLLDLFAQLCEKIIDIEDGGRFHSHSTTARFSTATSAWLVRFACGLLIPATLLGQVEPTDPGDPIVPAIRALLDAIGVGHDLSPGTTVVYIMGLLGLYHGAGYFRWPGGSELGRLAARELRQLRYLQTLQTEHAANLTRGFVGVGWRKARQFAEQPLTMPELVRRYRTLAAAAASRRPGTAPGLIIAIDEMDRIANAQSAENFLNQIKAIFAIPHCVYLVAVSDEALTQYERRISTLRTTIDTTFDEVVWLPEFTLTESLAMLQRRVTGFPDLFLALCHCLSGGVPRDLIRAARSLVDARRDTELEHLSHITNAVINAEISAYARGLLRYLHQTALTSAHHDNPPGEGPSATSQPDLTVFLLGFLEDPTRWRAHREQTVKLHQQGDRHATEFLAVLDYYAVVEDLYVHNLDVVEAALQSPPCNDSLALLESITTSRATLAVSPHTAIQQLAAVRKQLASEKPRAPLPAKLSPNTR